jgi:hypothetical protein
MQESMASVSLQEHRQVFPGDGILQRSRMEIGRNGMLQPTASVLFTHDLSWSVRINRKKVPATCKLLAKIRTTIFSFSTCPSIVKLESSLMNLNAKSSTLEQHRSNGTIPKDLLLPKKKSLFENEQPKVEAILLRASNALLSQKTAEIFRKKSETLAHRKTVEAALLKTLESSRDSQLKANCS